MTPSDLNHFLSAPYGLRQTPPSSRCMRGLSGFLPVIIIRAGGASTIRRLLWRTPQAAHACSAQVTRRRRPSWNETDVLDHYFHSEFAVNVVARIVRLRIDAVFARVPGYRGRTLSGVRGKLSFAFRTALAEPCVIPYRLNALELNRRIEQAIHRSMQDSASAL